MAFSSEIRAEIWKIEDKQLVQLMLKSDNSGNTGIIKDLHQTLTGQEVFSPDM